MEGAIYLTRNTQSVTDVRGSCHESGRCFCANCGTPFSVAMSEREQPCGSDDWMGGRRVQVGGRAASATADEVE
jgi:hypothetical protein